MTDLLQIIPWTAIAIGLVATAVIMLTVAVLVLVERR